MTQLKLSVLVFCYNQEKTISQTIESIVTQEHPYSYELIICDDASKDSTPEIIKKYHSKYPDIIKPVLREKNLGLIGNFYDGVSKCTGEYMMFCAGDDYWLPQKINIQIKYMEDNSFYGMAYTDSIIVDSENKVLGYNCINKRPTFKNLIRKDHIIAGTMCIRNSLFKSYLKEVNPIKQNWLMEDYPLILWYSIHSKICHIPIILFAYRKSNDSITRPNNHMKLIDFYNSEMEVRSFYYRYISSKFIETLYKDYIKRLIELYFITKKSDVKDYIYEKILSIKTCKNFKINCKLRVCYASYNKLYYYSSRLKIKIISLTQSIIPKIKFKGINHA